MAKITGTLQFTGKLGNTVGMKGRHGENYARLYQGRVKNPRTIEQCVQRMIAATASVALSRLKAICDNSVEGLNTGADTLDYIRSQWMTMLRTSDILSGDNGMSYIKRGEQHFAPNPFLLSKGSLDGVAVTALNSRTHTVSSRATSGSVKTFPMCYPDATTGNQITYVFIGGIKERGKIRTKVYYLRFAAKSALTTLLNDDGHLNSSALNLDKCEGPWDVVTFTKADGRMTCDASALFETGFDLLCAGIIVSNRDEKKRSTAYLTVAELDERWWAASDAYATYGNRKVSIDVASEIYLNNSTDVVEEAQPEPDPDPDPEP